MRTSALARHYSWQCGQQLFQAYTCSYHCGLNSGFIVFLIAKGHSNRKLSGDRAPSANRVVSGVGIFDAAAWTSHTPSTVMADTQHPSRSARHITCSGSRFAPRLAALFGEHGPGRFELFHMPQTCTVGSVLSVIIFTHCRFTVRPMLAESGVVPRSVLSPSCMLPDCPWT